MNEDLGSLFQMIKEHPGDFALFDRVLKTIVDDYARRKMFFNVCMKNAQKGGYLIDGVNYYYIIETLFVCMHYAEAEYPSLFEKYCIYGLPRNYFAEGLYHRKLSELVIRVKWFRDYFNQIWEQCKATERYIFKDKNCFYALYHVHLELKIFLEANEK